MWTRKELKERGKATFKLNYWKTVLIALIMAVILGGAGGFGGAASAGGSVGAAGSAYQTDYESGPVEMPGEFEEYGEMPEENMEEFPEEVQQAVEEMKETAGEGSRLIAVSIILMAVFVIFLVVVAIAMLVSAFLLNPLEVGARRFFVQNLHMPAEVKEIAFGYDHCYKNIVKTMFFRDLYLILWGLLFVIPGIVKSYEYRMIPYLLAEHPEMTKQEAFARSKEMMNGQKWRAFVLELSFLGWDLLSLLTLGILGTFYVGPYRHMTNAALYEALQYGNGQEESVVWTES